MKIPAHGRGRARDRADDRRGRSINVTLIFSLERYAEVMEAYLSGLEALRRGTSRPGRQRGQLLHQPGRHRGGPAARGRSARPRRSPCAARAAIAQGKLAYELFLEAFSGPRWEALAARGARLQRPLWASTSTKNPDYPDTFYVDALIGPDTVDTLPDATIEAFDDHGTLARTVDADVDEAEGTWTQLGRGRGRLDDVAAQLEREGVSAFQKSFDELLESARRPGPASSPRAEVARGCSATGGCGLGRLPPVSSRPQERWMSLPPGTSIAILATGTRLSADAPGHSER